MSTAYWCVLVAALLPYLTVGIAKALGRYDNDNPRAMESFDGISLRAHGAHQNGFEALPLFAVAVLVASKGSPHAADGALDVLALGWIALRLIYTVVYLVGWSSIRSIVWACAWALSIAIFTIPAWRG